MAGMQMIANARRSKARAAEANTWGRGLQWRQKPSARPRLQDDAWYQEL